MKMVDLGDFCTISESLVGTSELTEVALVHWPSGELCSLSGTDFQFTSRDLYDSFYWLVLGQKQALMDRLLNWN